ncbi:hypothetical protein HIM_11494 [Hirsutella minnesotensis 3608]|uniref:Cell wall protein n=1 Tax=Hirsutella minnesotensis 3608 TaxID=1043627 RepID=A0A0F7ZJ05_9HYPO|nr:hypothetical protein HIM_11494 [Hirsutella minnesotensis 3608]
MKFSAQLAVAALVAGAFAVPVVERDLRLITGVFDKVSADIRNLDAAVTSFQRDTAPVYAASGKLVATIDSGASEVGSSPDLSLGDALGLTSAVDGLKGVSRSLTDHLLARRKDIEQIRQCTQTLGQFERIVASSTNLINAIVSKVPGIAQGIARNKADEIITVLNQAKNNFAPGNCNDA